MGKNKSLSKPKSNDAIIASQLTNSWPFDDGFLAPFQTLRREVDDIFDQFTGNGNSLGASAQSYHQIPAMDIDETKNSYEISAEMPGIAESDIDVSVTDNVLTIHGEKHQSSETEEADHRISERSYGSFERLLSLPVNCNAKAIKAKYDNGVLRLSVPKPKEPSKTVHKIAVKSAK